MGKSMSRLFAPIVVETDEDLFTQYCYDYAKNNPCPNISFDHHVSYLLNSTRERRGFMFKLIDDRAAQKIEDQRIRDKLAILETWYKDYMENTCPCMCHSTERRFYGKFLTSSPKDDGCEERCQDLTK